MAAQVYSDPLPVDPKTNPRGINCGSAGVGLATSKTPAVKDSWIRHGVRARVFVCDTSPALKNLFL